MKKKTGWGDPLNDEILKKWKEWLMDLKDIQQIQIDRCVKPVEFKHTCRTELHHFTDASTTVYGAVSYLRLVNEKGEVRCSLLFARSRVSPLKQMTIPGLN